MFPVAVAAVLLTFSALCAAQPNAPTAKPDAKSAKPSAKAPKPEAKAAKPEPAAERPDVKVDDRWVYRRTDKRMQPPTSIYEIRVTFVDSRAIVAVVEPQASKKQLDTTWTRDWNVAVSADGAVTVMEQGMFQFPLSPGRQYSAAWDIRRPNFGEFHVRHERKVNIVGWEDIEVPAGKFRALKIEANGYFRRIDREVQDEARNIIWYVPQVKRWVKSLYQDVQLQVDEELYFYRVQ